MDIFKTIEKRRSVRMYEDKPVSDEDLNRVLEAARLAPCTGNRQGYKFVIVKDKKKIARLKEISRMPFVDQAPIVIVAVTYDFENKYHLIDIAIAVEHIALAATGLGLGTCWIGAMGAKEEFAKVIEAPKTAVPIIIMPIGYPADREIPKRRKPIEEIVSYEKY